jgi:hypothetical protein
MAVENNTQDKADSPETPADTKVVADYFGNTIYDMHIVDMFFKALIANDIQIFSFDATNSDDVKISLVERGEVSTDKEQADGDERVELPDGPEGSETESTPGDKSGDEPSGSDTGAKE